MKTQKILNFIFLWPTLNNFQAVLKMCDDYGVPEENVAFDDFGGDQFLYLLFFYFLVK